MCSYNIDSLNRKSKIKKLKIDKYKNSNNNNKNLKKVIKLFQCAQTTRSAVTFQTGSRLIQKQQNNYNKHTNKNKNRFSNVCCFFNFISFVGCPICIFV